MTILRIFWSNTSKHIKTYTLLRIFRYYWIFYSRKLTKEISWFHWLTHRWLLNRLEHWEINSLLFLFLSTFFNTDLFLDLGVNRFSVTISLRHKHWKSNILFRRYWPVRFLWLNFYTLIFTSVWSHTAKGTESYWLLWIFRDWRLLNAWYWKIVKKLFGCFLISSLDLTWYNAWRLLNTFKHRKICFFFLFRRNWDIRLFLRFIYWLTLTFIWLYTSKSW